MCDKTDCLLKKEFRTFGWEICRRTGLTFDDIYIHWHEMVQEYVVYIKDEFAGYIDGFWQQGHIYHYYDDKPPKRNKPKKRRIKRM